MSNTTNLYDIYKADCHQLAKTLVIKSAASAEALNNGLVEYGFAVDTSDPTTWMYYLNLAGEYHAVNDPMTIISLDTREEIEFTKANLLIHRATAREYTYGSIYYKDLARRYPDQLALIRGIINPVDINKAINAPDHTILFYDASYVEEWEENLIPTLQHWITAYMRKYYHADFALVEDLYVASALAMLHFLMPRQIINIRQRNARTRYVHSFHLWSYLASHNYLDDYREFVTRKQAMWLYRDIRWLERNAGLNTTRDILIGNTLSERGFPIGQYSFNANSASIVETLYNTPEFQYTPLNLTAQQTTKSTKSVQQLLVMQQTQAVNNPENLTTAIEATQFSLSRVTVGAAPTKVLQSEITDTSLFTPVRLSDVLFNHWLYWSGNGTYTAVINVQNPASGETLSMSAADARVAFIYCINRTFGTTLTNIPVLRVYDVLRDDTPTFATLRGLASSYYVPDDLVRAAKDLAPPVGRIVSTEKFYSKCVEIRTAQLAHRELYSLQEHYKSRGQLEAVCRHLYADTPVVLAPPNTSFVNYFAEKNWNLLDLTDGVYEQIALSILSSVTGDDLYYSKSTSEIHAAMLRLFLQMSSYSIQAIQSVDTTPAAIIDWHAIRVGDIYGSGSTLLRDPWVPANVKHVRARARGSIDYQTTRKGAQLTAAVKGLSSGRLDIDLDITLAGVPTLYIRGVGNRVGVSRAKPRDLTSAISVHALSGLTDWTFVNESGAVLTQTALNGLLD